MIRDDPFERLATDKAASGGTLMVSWGAYGGFYFYRRFTTRMCLGWLALTWVPMDIDVYLDALMREIKARREEVDSDD